MFPVELAIEPVGDVAKASLPCAQENMPATNTMYVGAGGGGKEREG